MWIGYLEIDLHVPDSGSLKSKRAVLKSIKDRVRSRYNVTVAEFGGEDKWQGSSLALVTVSSDKRMVNSMLDKIVDWFNGLKDVYVLDYRIDFLNE
ncbi:MAG TPA: DUF503 domain-containing protein [Candidatus Omnitrophica bacterium]|nr:DUF503 domain-containing protein [Candidatus Omnitrophota bacterium]